MKRYELVVVPDNPLMPMAYPPRVILEAETVEQVSAWFKEAQDQGQYAGCRVLSVKEMP